MFTGPKVDGRKIGNYQRVGYQINEVGTKIKNYQPAGYQNSSATFIIHGQYWDWGTNYSMLRQQSVEKCNKLQIM